MFVPSSQAQVEQPALGHAEASTRIVLVLTAVTTVAELVGGWLTDSLSLWADGWHMLSDVGALALAAGVYALARWQPLARRLVAGPRRLLALAGFVSSAFLVGISIHILMQVYERVKEPQNVFFTQALWIAVLGLVVNLVAARVLHGAAHHHDHDHNVRAAYLHVCADALTSVLAIGALCAGHWWGIAWADPAAAFVGALVVGQWAVTTVLDAAKTLIDYEKEPPQHAKTLVDHAPK